MAGYSGTPLTKKLGIKEGFRIAVIGAPDQYFDWLPDLPEVTISTDKKEKKDFIHYFVTDRSRLVKDMYDLRHAIVPDGMIWISWPKKASKVKTDITEDTIRDIALQNGLVDVKVCAIDDTWSALKLVIPVKDRKPKS